MRSQSPSWRVRSTVACAMRFSTRRTLQASPTLAGGFYCGDTITIISGRTQPCTDNHRQPRAGRLSYWNDSAPGGARQVQTYELFRSKTHLTGEGPEGHQVKDNVRRTSSVPQTMNEKNDLGIVLPQRVSADMLQKYPIRYHEKVVSLNRERPQQ